ncbi:response regulator transcription factor [Sciscionella sediminilitoris]|uniref:response regulator transcription factor n=1 Tax=Sciscionella sediminilitoris TaxID=1445613 RepID=UPI0004DF0106|nr:response regulator transcription factor [Sciscionella sp. SE31]
MTERTLRVIVADDQTAVREGLVILLDTLTGIEVVGSAQDGEGALDLVARTEPDVVLMDLRMPGCDGITATARIREHHPGTRVVVLTTYAEDEAVRGALRAGAIGFLTKDAGRADIARAIEAAAAGQSVLDAELQRGLLAEPERRPDPSLAELSERECAVLRLIAGGMANREIAAELVISEATVKSHINRIFAKIGATDRAKAVRYAFTNGLVS